MNHETTRAAELKVGIFVIGAVLILIIGTLWVSGTPFLRGRQTDYRVLMKSSEGIEVGDRVRMAGVTIGRVKKVRLRPDQAWPVLFQVGLMADVPIKMDSTAQVVTPGLLGDGFLQINPGSSKAPLLKQGGEILSQITPNLQDILAKMEEVSSRTVGGIDQMTTLMRDISEVSKEAVPLFKNLNAVLSEENTRHIRQILANLDQTIAQSGPRFSAFSARLDTITNRLDHTLSDASMMMKDFSGLAKDMRTSIGPEGMRLIAVLDQAEKTLGSAQTALSVIDHSRDTIASTMKDFQITASNLKTFSQKIKERPSRLIRISPEVDRRPGQGLRGMRR